jgi:hypothetical protein
VRLTHQNISIIIILIITVIIIPLRIKLLEIVDPSALFYFIEIKTSLAAFGREKIYELASS